jgi:hypothetical protein
MRRIIATAFGLAMAAVVLTGCDDSNDAQPTAANTDQQAGTSSNSSQGQGQGRNLGVPPGPPSGHCPPSQYGTPPGRGHGRPADVPRGRAQGVPPGPPCNVPPGQNGAHPGRSQGAGPVNTPPGQAKKTQNISAEGSLTDGAGLTGSLAVALAAAMVGGGLVSMRSRRRLRH